MAEQNQVIVTGQHGVPTLGLHIELLTSILSLLPLGRANVGKSTLLNNIAGRKDLCHAGKKPVCYNAAGLSR